MVQRIHNDGGNLEYVAMDEPLFFSSVFTGKGGCHVPVTDTVANAAINIEAMWAVFPDVQIGDIEPIVNVNSDGLSQDELVARYQQGAEAFKAALGKPLAFFDADLDWNSTTVAHDLTAFCRMIDAEGIPFGVIYNGDGGDDSDAAWVNSARRHMAFAEALVGTPDLVIFQSWNPYPKKLLPEADQDAFTSLVDGYYGARTKLTATIQGNSVFGELKTTRGAPIAAAPVSVAIRYRSTTGTPATYTVSGHIPASAVSAVLAIRVNAEGGFGPANIRVNRIEFDADGADPVVRQFASPDDLNLWGGRIGDGHLSTALIDSGALHVLVGPGVPVIINSAPIPLNGHGDFTLRVNATIPSASVGSGSFAVVFLGATKEIQRRTIRFEEPIIPLGNVVTDRHGRWSVPVPKTPGANPSSMTATADYDGDANDWPASAKLDTP
jgi:hypothetical protein